MKKITLKNKILLLLSFVFIFISSFAISTFAYHEDSNGNLVSDNLYSIGSYSNSIFGVDFSVSNQTLTLNGTSSSGSWNNNNNQSVFLDAGTYTIQWFTNYTGNDIGFGLRSSNAGLTELYQLNSQRYRTFTITERTGFSTVVWWQSGDMTFNNVSVSCMVYSGTYRGLISFEPYGQVFYSNDNLNKIILSSFGPFAFVDTCRISYNNGSETFIYKNFDSIYSLLNESYIDFQNNCIIINEYDLIYNLLGGNSSWTYTFYFVFNTNSINTSDFSQWYFYGNFDTYYFALDGDYSSGGPITNGNPYIVNLSTNYDNEYIYSLSFIGMNPSLSNDVRVGCPNGSNEYANGYHDGYNNGAYNIEQQYKEAIQKYKDNIQALSDRVSYLENGNRNYTNLIWTIGATPWESFKNIWNVEFGGINIANIVTGLVTALLVIYLIKKVWK